jgi:di/tricarboxylate transporter
MEPLTAEMITVMAVIGVAVFLFIVEWVRVDVVAILVMVSLPLLNLMIKGEYTFITTAEVFSGFSSNAVISIIAVIIVGAGLDKTGIINKIVEPILKLSGNSATRLMTFISATVAIISSFMQNIGAAALFLPAIKRACKTSNISISRMLMPVGFSAILGGTITLVGSSPLILLNDLLKPFGLKEFGLFDVTPVGLVLVAVGILLFIFFGNFILPSGKSEILEHPGGEDNLLKSYQGIGGPFELKTSSNYAGTTVRELREKYFVRVVEMVDSSGKKIMAPVPDEKIGPDTDLAVYGFDQHAHAMAGKEGMFFGKELDVFKEDLSSNVSGNVEAVISPRSNLEGKTLSEVNFQEMYNVTPIAIYRNGQVIYSVLVDVPLLPGDAILFHGKWESLKLIQKDRDLILSTPIDVEPMKPEKAFFAVSWFIVAMIMIIVFKIKLSICLMTGALGLILTRVVTIDEAYNSVDWRTIFLLAGLIPLGIATQKSGTAEWIAKAVLTFVGAVSPIVLYSIIAVLSTIFTLVISNVGATVLLVPLVVAMAQEAGADPRMAALIVGIATSNSFLLPTHQVNALYMGPGKYKSIDFIKAGSLLSVVFIVVLIAMIYVLKMVGFY